MDLLKVPKRYIPDVLSKKDRKKQKKSLRKSRKLYKKGKYYSRPKVKSFKSRKSNHLKRAEKLYNVDKIKPSKELAKQTKCTKKALEKIVSKGRGSISGGNASLVDYHILKEGCKPGSKALKLARKTCKKQNKKCN